MPDRRPPPSVTPGTSVTSGTSGTSGTSSPMDTSAGRGLQRLARFMDSSIRLPGGYRIGWDGIIGLIPGFGDVVGLGVSAWIVFGAARLGASRATLARMAANVAIETVVGAVPILGDLFDLAFKANVRNMRLLERHAREPERMARHSRRWVIGFAVACIATVLVLGWAVVAVLGAILGLIF